MIQDTIVQNCKSISDIKIITIHSVKGQTFEAVMVVSAINKTGTEDGHWTQWIEDSKNEAARLAFVASSHPRHLLIWAVPSPINSEKELLRDLGFTEAP